MACLAGGNLFTFNFSIAMYTFFKKLVLFLVIVISSDRILGWCMKELYFSQKTGQFADITYAIDSARQDIIIFGSSRAYHHYSTSILSQQLSRTCYNTGMDAQMIPFSCAMQEAILSRYQPELIIFDISPWEINEGSEKYEKLAALSPYITHHPELLKYTDLIGPWENFKLNSKVYPYNSSLFISLYNTIAVDENKSANGYVPLTRVMSGKEMLLNKVKIDAEAKKEQEQQKKYDQQAIQLYKDFLNRVDSAGIKTFVVISPALYKSTFNQETIEKLKSITNTHIMVTFLDFSLDPVFIEKPDLFSDIFHLNKKGAEIFTGKIVPYFKDVHPNRKELYSNNSSETL